MTEQFVPGWAYASGDVIEVERPRTDIWSCILRWLRIANRTEFVKYRCVDVLSAK